MIVTRLIVISLLIDKKTSIIQNINKSENNFLHLLSMIKINVSSKTAIAVTISGAIAVLPVTFLQGKKPDDLNTPESKASSKVYSDITYADFLRMKAGKSLTEIEAIFGKGELIEGSQGRSIYRWRTKKGWVVGVFDKEENLINFKQNGLINQS